MTPAVLADLAVGGVIAIAGWFVITRGSRRVGWWLALASAAWLAGSIWPTLALAHRAPLVAALLVGRPYRASTASSVLMSAVVSVAGLTVWVRGAPTTVALGIAVIAVIAVASTCTSSRSLWWALRSPGGAYGVLLVAAASSRAGGAVGARSTAIAYSIGVVAVVLCLVVFASKPAAERFVMDLASVGRGGSLEDRLRVALGDPTITLLLSPVMSEHSAGGITELRRSGRSVGALHHRRGLRLDRQLIDGLGAIVGLASDAIRLRTATVEALTEIERAGRDLADARRREAVALASRVVHGPTVHLDRALARVGQLPVAAQILAAQRELAAVADGLAPSAVVDEGLGSALAARVASSPIPVDLVVGDDLRLASDVTYAVFLICSEAMANAIKHSSARRICVRVARTGSGLEAEISDDGSGGANIEGSGVRGLCERAASIGGRLTVSSPPHGGTRVRLVVPVVEALR